MTGRPANDEMVQGYMDGYDLDAPEPSENRSHSYRHGFLVGRSEKVRGKPAAPWSALLELSEEAMARDEARIKIGEK